MLSKHLVGCMNLKLKNLEGRMAGMRSKAGKALLFGV